MQNNSQANHQNRGRARCFRVAVQVLSLVLFIVSLSAAAVFGEGFPGIGNRNNYADALPHYNLGNKYLAKEWYEKAVEKYWDAIGIYEYDADVYTNLSVAYRKLNNLPEAEKACRKACELKTDDWTSWSNLGNILMAQENFPDAYKNFNKAMKCPGIPESEKTFIESNIDGMKKILKARGLTIEGKDIASPVVPSTTSKKVSGKTSKAGSAGKPVAKVAGVKAPVSPTADGKTSRAASAKSPSGARKNQLAGTKESEIDKGAYDQWLGE